MIIPAILSPKALSIKNRWSRRNLTPALIIRDLFLFLASLGVMYGIYEGVRGGLSLLSEKSNLVYLHPTTPLSLILFTLLLMLFLSNCAIAVGALFTGRDLDLVLASPLSRWQFFYGKAIEVTLSSSWMILIFGVPALAAFSDAYGGDVWFLGAAILIAVPYLLIPSMLAILVVTFLTSIIPAHRAYEILFGVAAIFLLLCYGIFKSTVPVTHEEIGAESALQLISIMEIPSHWWSPAFWIATVLGEWLDPTGAPHHAHAIALISVAVALSSLAFLLITAMHRKAYSLAKSTGSSMRLGGDREHALFAALTPFLSPPQRALFQKEYKTFLRDITQAIQLLMLLGITTIYLYNFGSFRAIDDLPDQSRFWWQGMLIIGNYCIGAFVMTAVSTRFVFPSISLEGQSLWILQKSPVSIAEILRTKFWCWFVPLGIISSIIFGSGALAIQAEPHIVLISALSSWIVCYGIVGLAIGFGAVFAQFDWEHASQLSASFGSLLYMVTAIVLVVLNLVPTALILFLRTLRNFNYEIAALEWYLFVSAGALLLAYGNYAIARAAIKYGERALYARLQ